MMGSCFFSEHRKIARTGVYRLGLIFAKKTRHEPVEFNQNIDESSFDLFGDATLLRIWSARSLIVFGDIDPTRLIHDRAVK